MSLTRVFAEAVDADRDNPLLVVERPETSARLPDLAGRDVLDLGAGQGHYAHHAQACGARRVVALDLSSTRLARVSCPAVAADAAAIPMRTASCDVVIAALVLAYVDRTRALPEIARVLRPGGVLVASELHAEGATRGGWRRTFRVAGETVAVEAPPPAPAELTRSLERAGLCVERLEETRIDGRLEPEFRRAGRRDFARLAGLPLLLHVVARRGPDG